jgi:hypothetical protein
MKKVLSYALLLVLSLSVMGCINRTPYTTDEEEEGKVVLSVFMTKQEIIKKLGEEYTLITEEGTSHNNYHTKLQYESVVFHYYHEEEEMAGDLLPETILLTGNDYTYNFDIEIGTSARDIIRSFRLQFDRYYDMHRGDIAFDIFKYRERRNGAVVDTNYLVQPVYEDDRYYESIDDISSELKVVGIKIFIPM